MQRSSAAGTEGGKTSRNCGGARLKNQDREEREERRWGGGENWRPPAALSHLCGLCRARCCARHLRLFEDRIKKKKKGGEKEEKELRGGESFWHRRPPLRHRDGSAGAEQGGRPELSRTEPSQAELLPSVDPSIPPSRSFPPAPCMGREALAARPAACGGASGHNSGLDSLWTSDPPGWTNERLQAHLVRSEAPPANHLRFNYLFFIHFFLFRFCQPPTLRSMLPTDVMLRFPACGCAPSLRK